MARRRAAAPPVGGTAAARRAPVDAARRGSRGEPVGIPFGVLDLPHEQRRAVAEWDPGSHGNLLVLGAPSTGTLDRARDDRGRCDATGRRRVAATRRSRRRGMCSPTRWPTLDAGRGGPSHPRGRRPRRARRARAAGLPHRVARPSLAGAARRSAARARHRCSPRGASRGSCSRSPPSHPRRLMLRHANRAGLGARRR